MMRRNWLHAVLILTVALLVSSVMFSMGCKEDPPPPPPPECEDDMDCPGGKACEGGKCVVKRVVPPPPECTVDADCSDNKICVSEKCKYECRYDSDCSSGEVCESNKCKEADCEVQTVSFDFNEYYLTSSAESKLRANASCLKKKDSKINKVVLEGHCDERGSIQYNLSLGQKRAKSVRDFLVDLGVDASKVKVISYGEERPVDSGHDEDAWSKNRRAETIVE